MNQFNRIKSVVQAMLNRISIVQESADGGTMFNSSNVVGDIIIKIEIVS